MKLGAQYFTIRDFCKSLEDFDTSCKKVADMGYSIVQLSGIGDFSGEEIRKILDKYNLKVVATHRPADKYLNDIEGEIAFHKAIGCDVYWLAFAGINPARFIEERGNAVACVHLKDIKVVGNKVTFAEVGYGNLNWQEIIQSCEKAGVKWALVEQDSCDGDPFDSLKISYDYIAENFPGLI